MGEYKAVTIRVRSRTMIMGVGGAGRNIINKLVDENVSNAELVAVNTNKQDLENTNVNNRILIGENLTGGQGAGSNPDIGEKSVEESIEEISTVLNDVDVLFLIGGMGKGTATGAVPVIAKAAKEKGIFTVVVATKPMRVERRLTMRRAEEGIEKLMDVASILVVFPNENIFSYIDKNENPMNSLNEILCQCVLGLVEIINSGDGNINTEKIESVIKYKNFAEINLLK